MAIFVQLWPLIIVAVVGAIQAVRFLSPKRAEPLHERVQSLCCPIILSSGTGTNAVQSGLSSQQGNEGMINSAFVDDPPPKYTPPPSYSTATARIIAQQVREQISVGGFSGGDGNLQTPDAGLPPYSPVYLVSYDPKLRGVEGASTADPQCRT